MATENSTIELSRSQNLILNKQENLLAIKENDWKRLKRIVARCSPISEWWSIAASFFFGIAASTIVALLTLPLQQLDSAKWVKPVLILTCVFCIVIGVICCIVHIKERNANKASLLDIQETIQDIELNFSDQITSET